MALHLRAVLLPEGVERDLFVADGRITFEPLDAATTVLDGGYLVPGLADAHAHLGLASPAPPEAPPEERVRASARAQLKAGVLAIREPGGPDRASTGIGPHEGLPRVSTGGRFLTPPGAYFPGLAREVPEEALPDAAEAARRVHAIGARIAIHASTPEAIEAAVEAGFDSIEHGIGLRDDHIVAMVARGIALVPTLTILPDLPEFVDGLGLARAASETMLSAVERHPEMARRAAEAGVLVLAGTDAGMGPHGMIREEIRRLLEAGLPQETALAAGSWAARRFIGLPGLEEGEPADLVGYPDDPREDPEVLARPALRVLDGRIVSLTRG